jgi:adenylate kinase
MLGPPGAGKGTQGTTLAARLGVPHLSTGDMLREARAAGTDLGREATRVMDRGELVPDMVMIGLVGDRLSRPDCRTGFVLDGFPRTVFQAGELERNLAEAGTALSHVVALEVDGNELVARLAGRRTCSSCNRPWSRADAERAAGRCAACGGPLVQRADDREEAVARRLEVYAAQTRELVDWYERKGLLRRVAGSGGRAEVAGRIDAAVGVPGAAG